MHGFTIMALEMVNLNPSLQVRERYYMAGDIKSPHHFPNTHHPQLYGKFSMLKNRAEYFHQRKTSAQIAYRSVWCAESFGVLNCKWQEDAVALC
jgi:hypothetical protein